MDSSIAFLLSEFGRHVGLPDLILDDEGYCCLLFDDLVVNIEVHEDSGMLYLYSRVGDLPGEDAPAVYGMLLEANYLYRGTAGCVLGLDRAKKHVALAYQFPYRFLDVPGLEKTLENFLLITERWRKKLAGVAREEPPSSSATLPQYSIQV